MLLRMRGLNIPRRWVDRTSGSRVHDVGATLTCSRVPGTPRTQPHRHFSTVPNEVWSCLCHSLAPEVMVGIANGEVGLERLLLRAAFTRLPWSHQEQASRQALVAAPQCSPLAVGFPPAKASTAILMED